MAGLSYGGVVLDLPREACFARAVPVRVLCCCDGQGPKDARVAGTSYRHTPGGFRGKELAQGPIALDGVQTGVDMVAAANMSQARPGACLVMCLGPCESVRMWVSREQRMLLASPYHERARARELWNMN